jgi:hypothetical protein
VENNIRLLDVPRHIIEKYKGLREGNKLLPIPSYTNCRYDIKKVTRLCCIKKR